MVSSDWTEISFRVQWQKLAWLWDHRQVEQSRKTVIVIRWFSYGRAIAQRIKGTPGITGWWFPRVHIDGIVWHLDVGSSHPGAEEGPKGSAVRRLKWYVSWVQNVRQFGPYLPQVLENWEELTLVREDRVERTNGVPVVPPGHCWVAKYGRDNRWKHLREASLKTNFPH